MVKLSGAYGKSRDKMQFIVEAAAEAAQVCGYYNSASGGCQGHGINLGSPCICYYVVF